jgi:hypothetical protein
MKLAELVRCPVKVQRCAGRVVQTELIVQVDQRDVVPGDIVIFEPGDLFPGDVRLLSSKHLVVRYATWKAFSFLWMNFWVLSFHSSFFLYSQNFKSHDHILLLEQSVLTNRGVHGYRKNSWHQRRSEHSFTRVEEHLLHGG